MAWNHRGLPCNGEYNIQYIGTYIHTHNWEGEHSYKYKCCNNIKFYRYHNCHVSLEYKPQSDTNGCPQYHSIETVLGTPLAYTSLSTFQYRLVTSYNTGLHFNGSFKLRNKVDLDEAYLVLGNISNRFYCLSSTQVYIDYYSMYRQCSHRHTSDVTRPLKHISWYWQ